MSTVICDCTIYSNLTVIFDTAQFPFPECDQTALACVKKTAHE